MGPTISQEALKAKRWSRDVSKLFNCAKMADSLSFVPKFIRSLRSSTGKIVYALISEDGDLYGLSHETLSITESFSQRLLPADFLDIAQGSDSSLILVSKQNMLLHITSDDSKFCVRSYAIDNPRLALPLPNSEDFVVISDASAAYLCHIDGSISSLWGNQDQRPLAATILKMPIPAIAISTESSLLIGRISEDSSVVSHQTPGFWKVITSPQNGIFAFSAQRDQLLSVKINESTLAILDQMVIAKGERFTDMLVLGDQSLVGCSSGEIFVYKPDGVFEKREFADCIGVLPLSDPHFFVVFAQVGKILICRTSELSQKGPYEQKQLHGFPLAGFCGGDEYSFVTCDEAKHLILWENTPDWWDAPYHLRLFPDGSEPTES